jgi:glucose/arabinose dehydrogenase
MAFAPDGRAFFTERIGRVRVIENDKLQSKPFITVTVPNLSGYHETGLLGIALHPDFATNPYVYVYYTYPDGNRMFNRVARYKFGGTETPKEDVLINRIPAGRIHNGGILVFGPDGNLYISTGETGNPALAQNLNSTAGKILRITPNGGIPANNPFPRSPVFSYGHRNVFGIAFNPATGALFITENGPSSDDEINVIQAGKNYGWPNVLGKSTNPKYTNPILVYSTVIAPTQALFYTGNKFSTIKDQFVFGTYDAKNVHALALGGPNDATVTKDTVIFTSNQPIIGAFQAPNGDLFYTKDTSIQKITALSK